ncbi:hypothetical protein V6U78_12220 [Marinospirillum sp. MEB164]|uniref:Pimeloyl-[acyl-carrier protein] methyl ester esterase n=1 Tax=Marinospirillum alkalitolerans TaxID=3123374 RepID=A0ABW8PZT5_9GAMM
MLRWITTRPQPDGSASALPCFIWLPGWSFMPEVFLPWIKQLPGEHWGLDWQRQPPQQQAAEQEFAQLVARLLAHPVAQRATQWIGWSLGGWVGEGVFAQGGLAPQAQLITLGSTLDFAAPELDLAAFQAQFAAHPQRSLAYFARLCCQGAPQALHQRQQLIRAQLTGQTEQEQAQLALGLAWLAKIETSQWNQPAEPIQRWVAATGSDRLCRQPFADAQISTSTSHVFFLDPAWIQASTQPCHITGASRITPCS